MNDGKAEEPKNNVEFEYQINEPPQKVWRAISMPEFREYWLPDTALADPEATSTIAGEEVSYRMRDKSPPFLESAVTFRITPNGTGGTILKIIHALNGHELNGAKFDRMTGMAANNDFLSLRLAA